MCVCSSMRSAESDATFCSVKLPRAFHALTPEARVSVCVSVCVFFACV